MTVHLRTYKENRPLDGHKRRKNNDALLSEMALRTSRRKTKNNDLDFHDTKDPFRGKVDDYEL